MLTSAPFTRNVPKLIAVIFLISVFAFNSEAQRKMENLGRGLVAVRRSSSQVLVSWRIPVPEFYNGTKYNLYRGDTRIAADLEVSNYVDNTNSNGNYSVAAVVGGVEQSRSAAVSVVTYVHGSNTIPCLRVPIRKQAGYTPGLIWVGDLDGDGEYDFVIMKTPSDAAKTQVVEAYKRDGTFLWQLDCGPNSLNRNNIEPGSSSVGIGHNDCLTVYDINNDGKAEVIMRTANGVKFSDGSVLKDANDNRLFISVMEGMTGKELARASIPTDYISDGPMSGHMGIAYLDGVNPSIIFSAKNRVGSGGFNMMVTAYGYAGSEFRMHWKWLRGNQDCPDGHNVRTIDVDGDGKDEIIPFGYCLKPDGTLLYSLGRTGELVHGDRFHVGDLDPSRPGLEGYAIQQDNPSRLAWALYDAKTGSILQKQVLNQVSDLARGTAGDFDPRTPGYEFWTFTDGIYNVNGSRVSNVLPASYPNLRIWWDGDLLSENLDNNKMTKWNYQNSSESRLFTFKNNIQWARNVPGFYGDILGDWREEVVYVADDQNSLLVFTATDPSPDRIYTLPHNPAYRNCMTFKGYYQSNMVDFYLGNGMNTPPKPNISIIGQNASYSLTTKVIGSGSVSKSPDSDSYKSGVEVTLTASPAEGWEFSGWSGALSGTEKSVKITINSDISAVAHFTPSVPSGTKKLAIISATAGAEQTGNPKENSFDGNTATRWANDNTIENAWITFDLGSTKAINALRIMAQNGVSRTYELKIEVGDEQMVQVWSGTTMLNPSLQTIITTEKTGRYVKISASGVNSDNNNWLSIIEAEVWGKDAAVNTGTVPGKIEKWSFDINGSGLIVRSPGKEKIDIKLYNAQGRIVSDFYSGNLPHGIHRIAINNRLPAGFYVMTIRIPDRNEVIKSQFIIQK